MISNPIFLLFITLLAYFLGTELQKKFKNPLLAPIVITTGILISYLLCFNIPYQTYEPVGKMIDFWLKPSVVALGVPLYLQLEKVKKQLFPLLISQLIGSIIGIISVCIFAKFLGANELIIKSLAPKSVTTPIAIDISNSLGGEASLTAVFVVFTGILGTIFGVKILQIFRIKRPIAQGLSLGTAAHGMGIVAAMRLSPKYASFASVGLIFSGIFTAIFAPYILKILFYLGFL